MRHPKWRFTRRLARPQPPGRRAAEQPRDIEGNAAQGNERCQLAIEVLTSSIRDYLGAYVVELGGVDAISFTGGIGEHSSIVRHQVLENLEFLGIEMDSEQNASVHGEGTLHTASSRAHLYVFRTDEELIVARQTWEFLDAKP